MDNFDLKPLYDFVIYDTKNKYNLFKFKILAYRNIQLIDSLNDLLDKRYLICVSDWDYKYIINPIFDEQEILTILCQRYKIDWWGDVSSGYDFSGRSELNTEFDNLSSSDIYWSNTSVQPDILITSIQAGLNPLPKSPTEKFIDELDIDDLED